MSDRATRGMDRRRLLCWCCAGPVVAFVPSRAGAIDVPAAVAAAEEPHHHVIFDNSDLRIMRVMIPPGEATDWHVHAHDFVITVLRGTPIRTETAGSAEAAVGEMVTDSVSFADYAGEPVTHRVANTGDGLNHQLTFEILTNGPGRYGPADRSRAPAFALVLDTPRLRAWRLRLAPGAFTPPVTQDGPGVRVILHGGRVIDTPTRGTAQETDVTGGDAAFLPPDTRSVANGGEQPLDLIEFELR